MIGLPPLDGGTKLTVTFESPATMFGAAGAPGTPLGVTAFEAGDGGPGPMLLVARTVQVYVAPLVRPPTVIEGVFPPLLPVAPPFDDVHVAV